MSYIGPFNLAVPVGVLANSSDVFTILDPDSGGAATFSVPLSANGLNPPTHRGARSMLEAATHNALTTMTTTQFKAYVDQVAATRGRTPVGSVTAFKNSLLISGNQSFGAFLTAHGLQRIVASSL